ncbi:hypothetical protein B0A48_16990 [Cryoendolithus antarcticus]|uniref:Octanoyltransferase n=1 Tax=Cryoendolithus antarcticus TaxID=1507870 RepID=A0A1V8SCC8_9PEZI|nr:hypothetical protein B0A48_16990 [Cryoendolithus antarcticus]
MLLRYIRLPNLTSYTQASELQSKLVAQHLAYKATPAANSRPLPAVITAQFNPVYTCGRREIGSATPAQQDFLRAGGKAEFHEALRGGQTTFHGPGQLVAYPIIDLKRHGLSPRCYVNLLESAVIKTCAHYGIPTRRTENPGVWIDNDRKICAVGVHLRRNVSSHGIGLNVSTDLSWFERIVACGLEEKSMISLEAVGVRGLSVEDVGEIFVKALADGLDGVNGIDNYE